MKMGNIKCILFMCSSYITKYINILCGFNFQNHTSGYTLHVFPYHRTSYKTCACAHQTRKIVIKNVINISKQNKTLFQIISTKKDFQIIKKKTTNKIASTINCNRYVFIEFKVLEA
mgnify:CR=1 FL=1